MYMMSLNCQKKTGENKSKIDLSQLTKKHVLHFVPSWCDYIHTYNYMLLYLSGRAEVNIIMFI